MNSEEVVAVILAMEEIESSSSSEDDDLDFFASVVDEACDTETHAKVRGFVEDVVSEYSDADFKKHFRLERSTCSTVATMFQQSRFFPSQERPQGGGTRIFPAEDYILVFLWFAGNKASYRQVADRFGIAESTVLRIINTVMDFFIDEAPNFIFFPTTAAGKRALADEFYQLAGFPDVLGCMDGSLLPIETPVNKIKSTYINRHDGTSMTLQAICDARKRFLDVSTGTPSRINDARIYKLSPISNKLENICENTFHILADGAYGLREWILSPFRNYELLSPDRKRYNDRFCSTRVVIENAFGILKKRFIQFRCLQMWDVDRLTKFVITCCVLHNICIDANDDTPPQEEENEGVENNEDGNDDIHNNNLPDNTASERELRRRGDNKRNRVCAQLR